MPIAEFGDFIKYASDQERRESLRTQWTACLPFMYMKMLKFESFDEFYERATGKNIDTRSVEEIRADIEKAHERMRRKE